MGQEKLSTPETTQEKETPYSIRETARTQWKKLIDIISSESDEVMPKYSESLIPNLEKSTNNSTENKNKPLRLRLPSNIGGRQLNIKKEAKSEQTKTYTVKPGDTIYNLALSRGLDKNLLKEME